MHRTKRLCQRVRRILEQSRSEERARLDGLEVSVSGFSEWLEAGGERRKKPRLVKPPVC